MGASSLPSPAYEGGAGSPLVLLHGLGGTWHIWKPVLAQLERHHRVIALTLPGHYGGPELPPGEPVTVELMADVLERDLRARGIERAHVAGNSLGGWLSLELARRGMAHSVTALSPAGGWRTQDDYRKVEKPFRIVFALIAVLIFLFALFLRFAPVRRALNKQAMEHGDRMPAGETRGAMESLRRTAMLPALLDAMRDRGGLKPLDAGSTPICVAWCEQDKVIPFETYGRPVIETVRGAQSVMLPGVGHVPMYDDPALVSRTILDTARRAEAVPAVA